MKTFTTYQIDEALAHAAAGGQALHLHRIIPDRKRAPRCFVAAVDRGEFIAHLFDLDTERLKATAKRLGVKVVYIDREGTPRQHLDLCGAPLRKAIAEAERESVPEFCCPDHVETATGTFDPAGYDPEDCAGCGLPKSEHVDNRIT